MKLEVERSAKKRRFVVELNSCIDRAIAVVIIVALIAIGSFLGLHIHFTEVIQSLFSG